MKRMVVRFFLLLQFILIRLFFKFSIVLVNGLREVSYFFLSRATHNDNDDDWNSSFSLYPSEWNCKNLARSSLLWPLNTLSQALSLCKARICLILWLLNNAKVYFSSFFYFCFLNNTKACLLDELIWQIKYRKGTRMKF